MNLVLDTVQAGHRHRRESQIRIGGRVGEAHFDAASLRAGDVGDADRGRAVAGGVRQFHRGLEAGHQTLVGVGTGIGDGVERPRVLDDATDVVERQFRQSRVAIAREKVLAVLPDRLVDVHAGTVVADDGLGHESGGLAVLVRDVVHHVLENLRPVRAAGQRREPGADLALSGGGDFVVMHLHRYARGFQRHDHRGADIVQAIDRGNREVTALDARTVAGVAALELLGGRPGGFLGENLDGGAGHIDRPLDGIEDEELGFRPEVSGIADAGAFQVSLGALGDGARVAVITLAVGRFDHVAGQHQGGFLEERVDERRFGVRQQDHVGSLDALPARDG